MFNFNFPKKEKTVQLLKATLNKIQEFTAPKAQSAYKYASVALDKLGCISRKLFKKAREILKKTDGFKIRAAATALALVISLSATAVAYASEYTSAVELRYNGFVIGFAENLASAQEAAETVKLSVHGNIDINGFEFKQVTELNGKIASSEELIKSAYDRSSNIKSVCGLYVDGILKATAEDFSSMQAALNRVTDYYRSKGFTFKGYNNAVTLADIYATEEFYGKTAVSAESILNGDYGIEIALSRVEEYDEVIAFDSVVKENSNKSTSYKRITQKGIEGLRSVKAEVLYVNGQRVGAEILESTVINEPVSEVCTVGTKKTAVYHNSYCLASSIYYQSEAKMVFPVEFTNSTYISAFWGDGRGHKGLDIAAPYGTEIYAAADGTVTYSGKRGDYGYIIIIDHGDGKTETVYSHNSKNLVKTGESVTAGQLIAYVGRSGNATGNHLHFEVRINGNQVDAAPYVGLK